MAFDVGGKKKGIRPSMNVTPLVDVVLVLLIIFMVVTPLLTKQLSVRVPEKSDAAPPAPSDAPPPLMVRVMKDGGIRINQDAIDDAGLNDKLGRILAARTDKIVFFTADEDVPYDRAMQVLDSARATAPTIAVLTEPL